jgi:hypothetical protein
MLAWTGGSASFRGKWSKRRVDAYQKLYQVAEIRPRQPSLSSRHALCCFAQSTPVNDILNNGV